MPDAFFSSSKPRKRKRSAPTPSSGASSKFIPKGAKNAGASRANGHKKRKTADEELESDQTNEDDGGVDDMDLRPEDVDPGASGEEDEDETPAAKRLRLAKLYLESVKEGMGLADGEFDAAEIDKELISARLKQDVLEHSGKVHLFIADSFDFSQSPSTSIQIRGHRLSVTSAVASESCKYLFTAGKEGSIIKWDLYSGKKLKVFHKLRPPKTTDGKGKGKGKTGPNLDTMGHTDEVLALALSWDGKYLASGGKDRRLGVWDVDKEECVKVLGGHLGHKDAISALAFRKNTYQLYTASFDRTLKVYDLSPSVQGYVETLFGHQDRVLVVDALRGETCVSVGARDKTVRYWKIADETQLVFRGGGRSRVREILEGAVGADEDGIDRDAEGEGGKKSKANEVETRKFIEGSIECVAMIDETNFVSGGDSGSICMWNTQKKKPVFTQVLAHGFHEVHSSTEGLIQTPRWVTAIASLRYSDLVASGSWENCIRLWKVDSKIKSLSLIGTVPAPGVINSLQLLSTPKNFLDAASWFSQAPSVAIDPTRQPVSNPTDQDLMKANAKLKRKAAVSAFLLVAGMGQEHRLGRWLKAGKEEGVVNGALVVGFTPRTLE